ncbi:MAG TPA: penicillin-binding protein 1C [Candidatus Binatia bacterium]|nr:penicillin-binding protein 1C [Candidatus Binatia bacterium]
MKRARRATGVAVALLAAVAGAGAWRAGPSLLATRRPAMPTFADVRAGYRASDARLLDRHGEVLHEQRIDRFGRRLEWTPIAAVAPSLVRAVIASEDRRFASHGGVDAIALAASVVQAARDGAARRGASTIAMQLASLVDPAERGAPAGARRGALAKWRQMRAAWAIERTWSKDEILEAYLNLVAFRGELSGIAAAAHLLLGKAPHALSEEEAVVLAASIRAPNAGRAALARRAADLASRLDGGGAVDPTAIAEAAERASDPARPNRPRIALAPHAAARLLGAATGAGAGGGGRGDRATTAVSTLDASVQRAASDALERNLRALADRNVHDGAAIALDNRTGEVLAWVGAAGALASARHVDGVLAHRQAGSTLKPFLYGVAFDERRLTAASLVEDLPLALPVSGGLYRPRNYDEGYRGLVSARSALAGSLNVPAVRVLELVGVERLARVLRALGFAAVDRPGEHYGPALALGAADVSLAELANAYRALANGGVASPLRWTASGDEPPAQRVLSAEAAFVVGDVLSDRESRAATFGLENPLATRFWAAVKTGTSKDMRDNWCVGFSTRYTVGVWVGNASGAPMHDVSGVSGAAPAWLAILSFLHRDAPDDRPTAPAGLVRRAVAFDDRAEPARAEWFLAGTEPPGGAVAVAPTRPRIAAPVAGSVFAIDPDIPDANQRVPFAADGAPRALRWRLDGRDAGPAAPFLWPPAAGRHRLELVDARGGAVDEVAFEVRPAGSAPSPARPSSRRPPRPPGP